MADYEENILDENINEETTDNPVPESAPENPVSGQPQSEEPQTEQPQQEQGNFKWYAVKIISGHEKKVKTYLDSEIKIEGLSHKIRNVMLPMEKVFEVKNGKKRVKMKNFLPGYIIIEAELDDEVKRFIANAPSILNMVGTKNLKGEKLHPVPLRPEEIKRLNAIINEETQNEKIDLKLSVGEPVKVTSGPFNNFNGTVLEINTEKMKVKVMVSIFGRKTPIELEFTQIEREK
jgi:transcriptional antiterminator NusG